MTLDEVQERIGYRFQDPAHLQTALTHASFAHENDVEHNERLEFLGDAVLQMCTTLLLMERFPVSREGELSRLRARLVSTRALSSLARDLQLGAALRLGVGESTNGGRSRPSILANTIEAVLGAVHTDAGLEACEGLIRRWMRDRLEDLALSPEPHGHRWKDPKSLLQEVTQRDLQETPRYADVSAVGRPHELVFTVEVLLGDRVLATGTGRSKREAQRAAAAAALDRLMIPDEEAS